MSGCLIVTPDSIKEAIDRLDELIESTNQSGKAVKILPNQNQNQNDAHHRGYSGANDQADVVANHASTTNVTRVGRGVQEIE